MVAAHISGLEPEPRDDAEQRVTLYRIPWDAYVALNDASESPCVRMAYLEGELEIMSPSFSHETLKTTLGRLLELYSIERGVYLCGHGSTTFRKQLREAGAEPDECYAVGRALTEGEMPDIAIEVVVSSGGIDKLEIYARLGVREVWFWQKGAMTLHALRDDGYEDIARSELLPDLDIAELASFVATPDPMAAALAYREALRGRHG
jgi:Uma2 family endonuclease